MLRFASLLASLLCAAPLAAQQPVPAAGADTMRAGAADSLRPSGTTLLDTTRLTLTARDSVRRDSAVTPQADQRRGVDAEIRVALYDMLGDRAIPALSRLQWLASSPVALSDSVAAATALRGREDLLFLLAESYYRLGMDSAFRTTATQVVGGSGRYARLLQGRLLLNAYRSGDFRGTIELATPLAQTELRGMAALVAGLAAYQLRDYPTARTWFTAGQSAGGPYAQYAQYMDALTLLRSDTAQTQPALAALERLASSASGEFADQVRLTAAQLAYESERYDDAARLAEGVSASGGLSAHALLTRAWALYKAERIAEAGTAFTTFAARYPELPERDESRLMAGQVLLQLGRTQEAEQLFRTVADSAADEARLLQTQARGAMRDAAQALVATRAAGLLFLNEPAVGKTVALQDGRDGERAMLAAAFRDSAAVALPVASAEIVALDDIAIRVDSIRAQLGTDVPRRVFFSPASATANTARFASASGQLYAADVAVALAQFRLSQQIEAHAAQIAMLRQLRDLLAGEGASLDALAARLTAARDSLARLAVALDGAATRIRSMFQRQVDLTRSLAAENQAAIDSVRVSLGALVGNEAAVLTLEAQTTATYRAIADDVARSVDGAVSRHPTFALRDSVRARGERIGTLLAQTRAAHASTTQLIGAELARLEAGEPPAVQTARTTLASAEAQRATVEGQLVAIVDAELAARAGEMIASLRRDTEAAEFGSASASFFQALDSGTQPATPGTTGTTTGAAAGATSGGAGGGTGATPVQRSLDTPNSQK